MSANDLILPVTALAVFGVIVRPFRVPEYVFAVLGAAALVGAGAIPWRGAVDAAAKGADVYLFLGGMMLLAEIARQEGLFNWLAAHAVRHAAGSAKRLFLIVYGVGTLVTVFLSNDATAVVLTPAVYAAAVAARAQPLPYLLICAFVANAASFVLPISNPANLVIFEGRMPPLPSWLYYFGLPSIAAIVATYVLLWWTQRAALRQPIAQDCDLRPLPFGGRCAAIGILVTAVALMAASAMDMKLGLPTFIAGVSVTVLVLLVAKLSPLPVLRGVSWGILPLVAGLFILVEGVERTGVLAGLADLLRGAVAGDPREAAAVSGVAVAVAANLINNLPTGVIAATLGQEAGVPVQVAAGMLIGVDLGPNLSVTGSLATILWLTALRREGEAVTAWQFLKLGVVIMPPALLLALAAMFALPAP